jgi:sterol desaturase/sphingolipid hydroxylase (fatty acid hydroxylase superfamily)
MTISPEQIVQTITLIIVVLIVDCFERLRPAFPVNRRRELPLNLLAMAAVMLLGEQAKIIAHDFFKFIHLESFVSLSSLTSLPGPAKFILAIVLTDFSLYWVHRAMHGKLLWPTHRFHHSIGEIWWLSGARTSFTHLCLFAAPQIFIAYYLLDLSSFQIGLALSFAVGINIWLHANIRVNLGVFEKVLVTPNYHRIHHGAEGLTDKNLGFVFTIWDRLFGTYISPKTTGRDFPLFAEPVRKRLLRLFAGI